MISRNDLIDSSSTVLLLCSTRQRERDCGERPAAGSRGQDNLIHHLLWFSWRRRRVSIRDLQQLIAPFYFHLPICLIGWSWDFTSCRDFWPIPAYNNVYTVNSLRWFVSFLDHLLMKRVPIPSVAHSSRKQRTPIIMSVILLLSLSFLFSSDNSGNSVCRDHKSLFCIHYTRLLW